jgi:hypothetical protein
MATLMDDDALRAKLLARCVREDMGFESQCLLWMGSRNNGYGQIVTSGWGSRPYEKTHRLSFMLFVGPIPPGLHVLHRCDIPACCEPTHLFLGTHLENIQDMVAKGRHSRKLTEADVAKIKQLIALGRHSLAAIGDQFDITTGTVQNIRDGRSWTHISAWSTPELTELDPIEAAGVRADCSRTFRRFSWRR